MADNDHSNLYNILQALTVNQSGIVTTLTSMTLTVQNLDNLIILPSEFIGDESTPYTFLSNRGTYVSVSDSLTDVLKLDGNGQIPSAYLSSCVKLTSAGKIDSSYITGFAPYNTYLVLENNQIPDSYLTGYAEAGNYLVLTNDNKIPDSYLTGYATAGNYLTLTNDNKIPDSYLTGYAPSGNYLVLTNDNKIPASYLSAYAPSANYLVLTNDDKIPASYLTDYALKDDYLVLEGGQIPTNLLSGYAPSADYLVLKDGMVPASALPSYVDDIVTGWLKTSGGELQLDHFYTTKTGNTTIPEEADAVERKAKIYVDNLSGQMYRWSGAAYVCITDLNGEAIERFEAITDQLTGMYDNYSSISGKLHAITGQYDQISGAVKNQLSGMYNQYSTASSTYALKDDVPTLTDFTALKNDYSLVSSAIKNKLSGMYDQYSTASSTFAAASALTTLSNNFSALSTDYNLVSSAVKNKLSGMYDQYTTTSSTFALKSEVPTLTNFNALKNDYDLVSSAVKNQLSGMYTNYSAVSATLSSAAKSYKDHEEKLTGICLPTEYDTVSSLVKNQLSGMYDQFSELSGNVGTPDNYLLIKAPYATEAESHQYYNLVLKFSDKDDFSNIAASATFRSNVVDPTSSVTFDVFHPLSAKFVPFNAAGLTYINAADIVRVNVSGFIAEHPECDRFTYQWIATPDNNANDTAYSAPGYGMLHGKAQLVQNTTIIEMMLERLNMLEETITTGGTGGGGLKKKSIAGSLSTKTVSASSDNSEMNTWFLVLDGTCNITLPNTLGGNVIADGDTVKFTFSSNAIPSVISPAANIQIYAETTSLYGNIGTYEVNIPETLTFVYASSNGKWNLVEVSRL